MFEVLDGREYTLKNGSEECIRSDINISKKETINEKINESKPVFPMIDVGSFNAEHLMEYAASSRLKGGVVGLQLLT